MFSSLLLLTIACYLALVAAVPSSSKESPYYHWAPPGPDDVRAPCPMLNSLANHGFLPHDGKDINENDTVNALSVALNIDPQLGVFLFQHAITTNPTPNATTFSLDDLSRHNILEHDASLSRGDYYFGDDHTFNQTIFDETRSYWTRPIIDVQMAANARLARVHTSNETNPMFSLSKLGTQFSFGETAAYIVALGNRVLGTVPRAWVEYLFENERLPLAIGWTKRDETITKDHLRSLLQRVVNATKVSPEQAAILLNRGGFHVGL